MKWLPTRHGDRRGAGPSGTKRPSRPRWRAAGLSNLLMNTDARTARSTRPSGRVNRTSVRRCHAAALVARNERPVAKDEPPAVTAFVFRHGGEESPGFGIGEREQTQLTVPVDPGDDTRRPPTELSGAGVESTGRESRATGT